MFHCVLALTCVLLVVCVLMPLPHGPIRRSVIVGSLFLLTFFYNASMYICQILPFLTYPRIIVYVHIRLLSLESPIFPTYSFFFISLKKVRKYKLCYPMLNRMSIKLVCLLHRRLRIRSFGSHGDIEASFKKYDFHFCLSPCS